MAGLNGPVHLAGDSRWDLPGFSAKYMTYSLMDVSTSMVVQFEQVQLGEASVCCFDLLPMRSDIPYSWTETCLLTKCMPGSSTSRMTK